MNNGWSLSVHRMVSAIGAISLIGSSLAYEVLDCIYWKVFNSKLRWFALHYAALLYVIMLHCVTLRWNASHYITTKLLYILAVVSATSGGTNAQLWSDNIPLHQSGTYVHIRIPLRRAALEVPWQYRTMSTYMLAKFPSPLFQLHLLLTHFDLNSMMLEVNGSFTASAGRSEFGFHFSIWL